MQKPYFVELTVSAVVMAASEIEEMFFAEQEAREIAFDGELSADGATEVTSLAHLQRLDPEWTGDCIPYGSDGTTPLKEMLPEQAPQRDTRTVDMFAIS